MGRLVSLFAGPGVGKSTLAAALFAECKYRGHNTEIIPEFAKDAAWEGRGKKFFDAQTYIFGCQYFRVSSVIDEVDFAITDSPMLQSAVYVPDDYRAPSLKKMILEHHSYLENINIYLKRSKPYNPKGRYQTEDEAKEVDKRILELLTSCNVPYYILESSRDTPTQVLKLMADKGWIPERASDIITMAQRYQWIADHPKRFKKLQEAMKHNSGYELQDMIDVAIQLEAKQ